MILVKGGVKMSRLDFSIVEQGEDKEVWVLRRQSNDKTQSRDISILSKEYYEAVGKNRGEVIPFFVISQGYDKATKNFRLAIGGMVEDANLEMFTIPKGLYGKVTVKPKMGLAWGLSIGEAKRTFYRKWLPESQYASQNMEYEYHTEVSKGKSPQIDLFFAITTN